MNQLQLKIYISTGFPISTEVQIMICRSKRKSQATNRSENSKNVREKKHKRFCRKSQIFYSRSGRDNVTEIVRLASA